MDELIKVSVGPVLDRKLNRGRQTSFWQIVQESRALAVCLERRLHPPMLYKVRVSDCDISPAIATLLFVTEFRMKKKKKEKKRKKVFPFYSFSPTGETRVIVAR